MHLFLNSAALPPLRFFHLGKYMMLFVIELRHYDVWTTSLASFQAMWCLFFVFLFDIVLSQFEAPGESHVKTNEKTRICSYDAHWS